MRFRTVAIPIILVNIVMFILQNAINGFTEMFMLVSADVLFRPWILLTSMFMHANPSHLMFNMYALFIFGPLIEQRIGVKRFAFIYFVSGILAALISTGFYDRALGASGAIMGILGVTIMLMPDLQVLLFFIIPMSLRTAGIIFALVDIFGIFVPSGIANIAHLVGLACGLGFGFYLLRQKKKFSEKFVRPVAHTRHTVHHSGDYNKDIEMSKDELQEYLRNGRL